MSQEKEEATQVVSDKHGGDASKKVKFDEESAVADLVFYESPAHNEQSEFSERLYKDGKEYLEKRQKRAEEHQKMRDEKELEGVTFKPNAGTHTKYKNWDQFLQSSDDWVKRSKYLFAKKAAKIRSDAMEPCNVKIDLGTKSKELIKKMKANKTYASPVRSWKKNFEKFLLAKNASEMEKPPDHHPHISPAARHLKNPGDTSTGVFEKLYEDSQMRQAAQSILNEAQHTMDEEVLFRPVINDEYQDPQALGMQRSSDDVTASLLQKGDEYRRRRENRLNQQVEKERSEFTFAPKTNKHSRELIHRWGKRPPLHRPAPVPTEESTQSLSRNVRGIKPPPPDVHFDVDLFCSRIDRQASSKAEKLHQIKMEKLRQEANECTFRPTLSRGTDEILSNVSGTPKSAVRERKPLVKNVLRPVAREEVSRTNNANVDENDPGFQYLSNLEQELRGVIADWQNIEQ